MKDGDAGTLAQSSSAQDIANAFDSLEDLSALHAPTTPAVAPRVGRFLDVPYAERAHAKALGARWHPDARLWFVPQGLSRADFDWPDARVDSVTAALLTPDGALAVPFSSSPTKPGVRVDPTRVSSQRGADVQTGDLFAPDAPRYDHIEAAADNNGSSVGPRPAPAKGIPARIWPPKQMDLF